MIDKTEELIYIDIMKNKKGKLETVILRMPSETHDRIKAISETHGMSQNTLMVRAIESKIEDLEKLKPVI